MSVMLGTLTERLVHPTAPVLLTKSGPLGTSRILGVDFTQAKSHLRTHLEFENRFRSFRTQTL